MSELVDLPPPPSLVTRNAMPLVDARVQIDLKNGAVIEGQLKALKYSGGYIVVQTEAGKKPLKVALSEVAYMQLLEEIKLGMPAESKLYAGDGIELPEDNQTFRIKVLGHPELSGQMRTYYLDAYGLHIFKMMSDSTVTRLFFPLEAVISYQLGPLTGEELFKDGKLSKANLSKGLHMQSRDRGRQLGDHLKSMGLISAEQLNHALKTQELDVKLKGQKGSRLIGQILIDEKAINEDELEAALALQRKSRSTTIGSHLIEMGVISDADLHRALARKVGIPYMDLEKYGFDDEALACINKEMAIRFSVIPLKKHGNSLLVAMDDPFDKEAVDTLQFVTNLHIELSTAAADKIIAAIESQYHDEPIDKYIEDAEDINDVLGLDPQQQAEMQEAESNASGPPVVRLVSRLILQAIRQDASDIHIQPGDAGVDLIYRIDGSLIVVRTFSKSLLNAVISRIKIIGRMDIAERRLPQDGRARVADQGKKIDLRISIMPTVKGESAVIRLLNAGAGVLSIAELGFNQKDESLFVDMLNKSYGIILVTGPTGSGKSTTLYSAIKEVKARNLKIITVEDPVEYRMEGVEQIQVNTKIGYTFARALRQILRHDPDSIMIGEIRDEETGKIAIESALTGHLVLSTLHTNSAAGSVTRLLEMGIEPYLVSSSLLGIFAQRLARRNCKNCQAEEEVPDYMRAALGISNDEVFYRGRGCEKCHGTGYKGRLAVYELLVNTANLRELISTDVTVSELHDRAVQDGMVPLTNNALTRARNRDTSLSEVYKVRLD